MPREIFGEVSSPSVKLGSQARYTVPLSIAVHVALFATIIIVPLLAADVLPTAPTVMQVIVPRDAAPPPPPPPPPPAGARSAGPSAERPTATPPAPATAPSTIAAESVAATGHPSGVVGGVEGGLPDGVIGSVVNSPAPAPPPPPPSEPVRVGGRIKVPTKIVHVPPVYPAIAQSARVEGTVVIEATIGADGRVKDARVISSKPLLDQAAVDAVMKWRFTPTLLNGAPVPVLMTVTVTFKLS